jgi:hypothetical protein
MGNTAEVHHMITQGADVNALYLAKTPLMDASLRGHLDIVKLLLSAPGININAKSGGLAASTALMFAVLGARPDVVRELVKVPGIDINYINAFGLSALSIASTEELKNILRDAGSVNAPVVKEVKEDGFLNLVTIPADKYILFCSVGYRTIPDGDLPIQPYVWAQLFSTEPTPKDSWFCNENDSNNAFYVYQIRKPLQLLETGDYFEFGEKLINENPSLKDKIRFSLKKHAPDYVDIALQYNLFNVDGVYRDDNEIILFAPWSDKLKFVRRYGGETAKTTWLRGNAEKKAYFEPSQKLLGEVKQTLVSSPYYPKIQKYLK